MSREMETKPHGMKVFLHSSCPCLAFLSDAIKSDNDDMFSGTINIVFANMRCCVLVTFSQTAKVLHTEFNFLKLLNRWFLGLASCRFSCFVHVDNDDKEQSLPVELFPSRLPLDFQCLEVIHFHCGIPVMQNQ